MIWLHTVEAHFAKSTPMEKVTRAVVGGKGADAEGDGGRAVVLVRENKICRIVAFAESYQCFGPILSGKACCIVLLKSRPCVGFCSVYK